MKEKYIILIGGDSIRFSVYQISNQLSLKTILIKNSLTSDEIMAVDYPCELDLTNIELLERKVKQLCRQFNVKGIVSLIEYYVPVASHLAEKFSIGNFNSCEAVMNCRNKVLLRKCLEKSKIPVPEFQEIKIDEDVKIIDVPFPAIVKPNNCSSSNLVTLVHNRDQLLASVDEIKKCRVNLVGDPIESILIEEYMEGPEVSVETFICKGSINVITVVDKLKTKPPFFVEIGHSVPSHFKNEQQEEIKRVVKEAIYALGVDNCVTHTELIITSDGPKIVEMAPRPAGDYIRDIVSIATGIDLYEVAILIAADLPLAKNVPGESILRSSSIRFIVAEKEGYLKNVEVDISSDDTAVRRFQINIESGDYVKLPRSNSDRYGHVLVEGTREAHASLIADKIINSTRLTY